MVGRPTRNQRDLIGIHDHLPHIIVDTCPDGLVEGLGLLKDLFQHIVGKPALPGILNAPADQLDRALHPLAAVEDIEAVGSNIGNVAVLEVDHALGVLEERRHIRGRKNLGIPDTEDERARVAGGDDLLGVFDNREDGIRTLKRGESRVDRCKEIPVVVLLDEVDDHLGIGL